MTTARSRGLGTEIRNLRKAAGLRLEELSERCGWSRATLGRVESGDRMLNETEIAILLGTLGVKGKERARMLELAKDTQQTHWWEVYSGLPSQLVALLDFERKATKITDVSLTLIPGLLQIADYTRAIMAAGGIRQDEMEPRVALRLGRQSVLTRKDPVELHVILDESVLYRPVGGVQVLTEQLRHIKRMAQREYITVQILPFSIGAHAAMNGSHLILEFRRQRAIVHLEHSSSGVFLDVPAETSRFFEALPTLAKAALSPSDSVELLATRAAELGGQDGRDQQLA